MCLGFYVHSCWCIWVCVSMCMHAGLCVCACLCACTQVCGCVCVCVPAVILSVGDSSARALRFHPSFISQSHLLCLHLPRIPQASGARLQGVAMAHGLKGRSTGSNVMSMRVDKKGEKKIQTAGDGHTEIHLRMIVCFMPLINAGVCACVCVPVCSLMRIYLLLSGSP